ncbi:MAG: histidine phosphatase family protein [Gammaproteobacteria bacterium]|jgi:broad specificity phosphatase PhoE|nr:histidine phosphatase family protein [Gammaproteobacteria bacterium]
MSRKTFYILRHGQTEWNVARRMQGHRDSPLTRLGRAQADLHGRTLAREGGVEALIASPLGRTRDTAELVNAHLAVPVRFEAVLMERDCGVWSGLTLDEIEHGWPAEWRARSADPYHHRPPDGENLVDMEARVSGLVDALLGAPEQTLALVTHGVMSRVLIKRLLDLDPADAVLVRHPNELFYRLEPGSHGGATSAYFFDGQGPTPGLLHQNDSETIPAGRRGRPAGK